MAGNLEQLILEILLKDRASEGLGRTSKAAELAGESVSTLNRKLDETSKKSARARVDLQGDDKALASLDRIDAKLLTLDRKTASSKITVEGAARALAEIKAVDAELDTLGGKGGTAEKATASLGTGGLSGMSGMGALIGAGVALSPILATLGTGLAGFGLAAYGVAKPIMDAASKTGGLAANMKKLDPEQRTVATGILALGKQYDTFQKALKPEVLSVFNTGLGIAGNLLHDIQPVAVATGKAFNTFLTQVGADFQSGQWQDFFTWMAQQAAPDMQLLGKTFIDLMNTLPMLLRDLQPVATGLLKIMDGVARLPSAVQKLQQNAAPRRNTAWDEITRFIGWGEKHIPAGNKSLLDLANGTASVGKAAAVSNPALDTITLNLTTAARAAKVSAGATATMSANAYVLAQNTSSAAAAQDKLNQAWSTFMSMSTDLVTAQLGVNSNLKTMAADAKVAGATFTGVNDASRTLQSDFESNLVPGIENVIGSMKKAHASTKDLATVVATDLKPAVDAGALSNKALEQQIYDMAVQAGYTGPNQIAQLNKWIDKHATSAQNAADKVAGWAAQLAKLPGKVDVGVTVRLSATGGVNAVVTAPGVASVQGGGRLVMSGFAGGGMVRAGSGPTADDVLVRASRGELIVPAPMVRAGAVDHLRGQLPGFAAGGIVGAPGWMAGRGQAFEASMGTAFGKAAVAAFQRSFATAAASQAAGLGNLPLIPGPASGSAAVAQAFARSIMFAYGWTQGQWPYLQALWQRESSWNSYIVNASSGAAGIPQNIQGWAAYRPGDYQSQVRWGDAYILARYGNPQNAWAHEQQFGWYDQGGWLPPGLSLALNTTGKPERVGAGTTYVINVAVSPLSSPADTGRAVVGAIRAFEKRSGTSWRS